MAWKRTPHERFHVVERIRASGNGTRSSLTPEQEATLRTATLGRAVEQGLIPERDIPSWERAFEGDFWGVVDLLREMHEQRRGTSNGNGAVSAAAPRADDSETILAGAVREGRFRAERADYWRAQLQRDPAGTRRLLTAAPEDGGLAVLMPAVAASGARPARDEPSLIGAVSPRAALALGYSVQRPHPLGDNLPGRLQTPPPARRTNVIADRS